MQSKVTKITYSEFFVVLGYLLYISEEILNYTQFRYFFGWQLIRNLIISLTVFLFMIGIIINNRKSYKWLLFSICILAVGLAIIISSDQLIQTIIIILFIVSSYSIKSFRIFKYHWITILILVLFTLFLYVIGVYKPDYFYKSSANGNLTRHYLGFSYTTYPPNYLIHAMFSYYASKKKNINFAETFIFLTINYVFYRLTYTYAAYYEIILFVFVLWIYKIKPIWFSGKVFQISSTAFMPFLALVSVWLAINYDPDNALIMFTDRLLSSRLRFSYLGVMRYGLRLFGNPVEWVAGRYGIERFDTYFYVDSSYINIALTYGVVALFFIVLCFSIITHKSNKKHNHKLAIVIMFLALHSFSDPQLLELKYDPFLAMLLCAFMTNREPILELGNIDGIN